MFLYFIISWFLLAIFPKLKRLNIIYSLIEYFYITFRWRAFCFRTISLLGFQLFLIWWTYFHNLAFPNTCNATLSSCTDYPPSLTHGGIWRTEAPGISYYDPSYHFLLFIWVLMHGNENIFSWIVKQGFYFLNQARYCIYVRIKNASN